MTVVVPDLKYRKLGTLVWTGLLSGDGWLPEATDADRGAPDCVKGFMGSAGRLTKAGMTTKPAPNWLSHDPIKRDASQPDNYDTL